MTADIWNHLSVDGIATNNDPENGGIIDKEILSGEWFVIFNNNDIPSASGFPTKDAAFQHHREALDMVTRAWPSAVTRMKI
jgi:hypothetical protein